MQLDEWADERRMLSKGESPEPGRWDTNRVKYLREILRAYTDAKDQVLWVITGTNPDGSPIMEARPWKRRNEKLVIMSGAQISKTIGILGNIIGYHIDLKPLGMLVLQPSNEMLEVFSKTKLTPMLNDTPCLQGKVRDNKGKDSNNTIKSKEFPGGHVSMASAESPNSLRMRSVPVLLVDEIDGYTLKSGNQGDPFLLALTRTDAYESTRKIVITSTPLMKESSRIEPMYDDGTREQYMLPCPSCGAYQVLTFGRPQLDGPNQTFACKYCGTVEKEWTWKANDGRHVSRNPEAEYRSFHLSAMISPFKTWKAIDQQFADAQRDLQHGNVEPYKVFVNNVLAETYEEKGEALESDAFVKNRHWYGCDVPEGVLVLTAQADTQDNRVEVEVSGWGVGFERWGILKLNIAGTMDQAETREQIDALLDKVWIREDGAQMTIARYVQDSGGHYTDHVYDFTRRRAPRVFAVHGGTSYTDPLVGRESMVDRKGKKTPLFTLGVNVGKEMVFNRLKVEHVGPGFCHWPIDPYLSDGITPRGYDEEYFDQLTNEKRVVRYVSGSRHSAWVPKRKGVAVEAWDLMVYGLAAILIYGGAAVLEAKAKERGKESGGRGQEAGGKTGAVGTRRRTYSRGVG